jgi:hypothetical protein
LASRLSDKKGDALMNLLDNAIGSIKLALSEYSSGSNERLLSAVRNLNAGILLLYKQKLFLLSPPNSNLALLKSKIIPKNGEDGQIVFVGAGKKTVNVRQIQDHFQNLGITTHWKKFNKINDLRNDIEHYYTKIYPETILEILSDAFIIIRDFIKIQLNHDPMELLGINSWKILLTANNVYESEKSDCLEKLGEIDWNSSTLSSAIEELQCINCGSSLLSPVANSTSPECPELKCRSCGTVEEFEDYAERAIESYFWGENYIACADGGDPASICCPHCGHHSYVLEEEQCLICRETCEHECHRCGMTILPEELDGTGYCGYCNHVMSKDD